MTVPEMYPAWQASLKAPSGETAVEYKYVIVRGDEYIWESDIDNRMFTAEGAVLHLDDGSVCLRIYT